MKSLQDDEEDPYTNLPYRLLVTGSRTWDDATTIYNALDAIALRHYDRAIIVVHGACPTGADAHARTWVRAAHDVSQPVIEEPHRPETFGPWPRCGPLRNQHMVNLGADACIAFIGPCTSPRCRRSGPHGSHGASGCADLAEQAGIPTRRWTA